MHFSACATFRNDLMLATNCNDRHVAHVRQISEYAHNNGVPDVDLPFYFRPADHVQPERHTGSFISAIIYFNSNSCEDQILPAFRQSRLRIPIVFLSQLRICPNYRSDFRFRYWKIPDGTSQMRLELSTVWLAGDSCSIFIVQAGCSPGEMHPSRDLQCSSSWIFDSTI